MARKKSEIETVCKLVAEMLRQVQDDLKKLPSGIQYESRFYLLRSALYDAGRALDKIAPHALEISAAEEIEENPRSVAMYPARLGGRK